MKKTALGMFRCLNRKSKETIKDAEEFMQYISKNMDGRTFTIFNKLLDELRTGVLAKPNVSADSFLVFLDKIRNITPSPHLNELVIQKLEKIYVHRLSMNEMLENYKEHSVDYKFEANLREGEIRQFAKDVLPEARFLFDNYKVQTDLFKQ